MTVGVVATATEGVPNWGIDDLYKQYKDEIHEFIGSSRSDVILIGN